MSTPTPGPDFSKGGAPQGQPGWGTPQQQPYQQPGYQQQPEYPQPGYQPAPAYSGTGGPTDQMGMPDAVRSVLTKYATFSGRARRSEYWWFYLAYVIVSIVASIIDGLLGVTVLTIIVSLGLLIPTLAVSVRRLHDIGKSGWWLLIGLIPLVGAIILIVFACQDSQPGTNQWGPSPKYGA
jgi:uncharacterized membrane protein YhaH (DUF805 family)